MFGKAVALPLSLVASVAALGKCSSFSLKFLYVMGKVMSGRYPVHRHVFCTVNSQYLEHQYLKVFLYIKQFDLFPIYNYISSHGT